LPPQLQNDIFLDSLELTRKRYNFEVLGYVVMPEHVHLLLSEPLDELDYETPLSKALQSLKLSVSKRLAPRPFWQARYYDFNVFTHNKRVEKLKYMHRNPVTRGLVENPEDWRWSTYSHYRYNEPYHYHRVPLFATVLFSVGVHRRAVLPDGLPAREAVNS
jgi:putative transposase